ncbi:hypothetical protein HYZ78_03715 [Candidatus Microgenomates bacterium]|nr:hypothetical protein [Candidatus Microgenomates bacterium]
MVQRFLVVVALLLFAGGVLITSILRTVSPGYVFSQVEEKSGTGRPAATPADIKKGIEYHLAYPGILPDHFLWPAKIARDNIWLFLTTDPLRRSELLLLLADKRLGAAKALAEGGKADLAAPSAEKAEKYLQQAFISEETARNKGEDIDQLLDRLALSSLKHREILENLALDSSYPKKLYEELKGVFNYLKKPLPKSPFND